ncbi:MAG TPA: DsbA family oxidoreductase [Gemmatimonadales bacterium]|nr:DsbA family oxidoreductase [Gemmatimonadales bacterium]
MKIEIWSDIACPWCAIGKRRFERALEQFEPRDAVEVIWRSFELDPTAPRRHGQPQAELLAAKYGVPLAQAQAMNARMAGEAAKEGLRFDLDGAQVGNTFDAHRLIHFAAAEGRRDAVVDRLFRAYLAEGRAIGESDVLVEIAAEAGLDAAAVRAMLASDAYAAAVRADEARARMFGITGVPFFAIDERVGVSGAQPPEVLLEVLREAWRESAATPAAPAPPAGEADACADGYCAI